MKQLARLHSKRGGQQCVLPRITIQTIGMVYNFRMNPNNLLLLFGGEVPRTPPVGVFAVRAFAVVYILREEMGELQTIHKWVKCPTGHVIRLEVRTGTPNLIQQIQCPSCETSMVIIAGVLLGIFPDDKPLLSE